MIRVSWWHLHRLHHKHVVRRKTQKSSPILASGQWAMSLPKGSDSWTTGNSVEWEQDRSARWTNAGSKWQLHQQHIVPMQNCPQHQQKAKQSSVSCPAQMPWQTCFKRALCICHWRIVTIVASYFSLLLHVWLSNTRFCCCLVVSTNTSPVIERLSTPQVLEVLDISAFLLLLIRDKAKLLRYLHTQKLLASGYYLFTKAHSKSPFSKIHSKQVLWQCHSSTRRTKGTFGNLVGGLSGVPETIYF